MGATVEAPIHQKIKDHMALASTDERSTTVVLSKLSNATRVLKNDVTEAILEIEQQDAVDFSQIAPFASGQRTKHMWQESGDWNDSMWSCGQSVGLIDDIPTCKALCDRIVEEAEARLTSGASCCISKL